MDENIKLVLPPKVIGYVQICPGTYFPVTEGYPNWWFRFWQRLFLGFKWEKGSY